MNLKSVFLAVLSATLLFSFTSCKSSKADKSAESKQTTAASSIKGKYWKLIELNGVALVKPATLNKEPYFMLNSDGRVTGTGGCNTFSGKYELNEAIKRLRFSKMISTLMACPDMGIETEMAKIFEIVDNYSISENGKYLSLNKARMAPLARFELVKK
jgi:heat shock protein HslJ